MDGACGRTFGARSEMNGTLALWFEPHHPEAAASPPRLNLHVNVWKDISDSHNFLDLGFQFSDAADLGRFYLFFPVLFAVERVSDLSRIMKYSKTLSAVFNDVVEVAETADRFFKTEIDDRPHLTIHHIDDGDLAIEPVQMEDGESRVHPSIYGRPVPAAPRSARRRSLSQGPICPRWRALDLVQHGSPRGRLAVRQRIECAGTQRVQIERKTQFSKRDHAGVSRQVSEHQEHPLLPGAGCGTPDCAAVSRSEKGSATRGRALGALS